MASLYETDFYAWANEQAALLRNGQLSAADIENIAEEIESMGRSQKREVVSRLTLILQHLLKWQFQPGLRSVSCKVTIVKQREELLDHLEDNSTLSTESYLSEALAKSYRHGRSFAAAETDLPISTFPAVCPWSFEQIMNADFWPDHH